MNVPPPIRFARSLFSLTPRTVLSWSVLVLAVAGGSAQAQLMNDPADAIIYRPPSRFVKDDKADAAAAKAEATATQNAAKADSAQAADAKEQDSKKDNKDEKKAAVEPLPPEMQPQLDLAKPDSEAATPASAGEPIKARAVMVDINSNTLNYDKDHDVYVATGAVHMVISEQNSELWADKMTYDQNQDLVIAEGHVNILKNGQRTEGTYAKIDLTRESALINDPVTTISAVRVKAKQSFVNGNYIEMENGRLIISGKMFTQFAQAGGMNNLSQGTGKGTQQARLRREYAKQVYQNRQNQVLSYQDQLLMNNANAAAQAKDPFDDRPGAVSRFSIKTKELDIVRNEDNYDKITMKRPSLYAGKFKLFTFPDTDFSYDEEVKQVQYLGPDVGSNRAYGGMYAGPGWDFHLGRGSLRLSPVASYGSPGFWSSNGKDGRQISAGLGVGAVAHFRDPDTAIDLAYNSHVGSPVLFADRRIWGQTTHVMASVNDFYYNGLLGQQERPNYIAQLTDYRVLKNMGKFQLTSFESLGYARDNFYPNFRQSYFVESKGGTPQTLGRAQLQLQLANVVPLVRMGKYASLGMRAQLISGAYTSGDFVGLARIGPTMNFNLLGNRLNSSVGFTLTKSFGQSPFVFDSYYGGAQNVSLSNLFKVNKYLSLGTSSSFSLRRDNAKGALAVGNSVYMLVGPQDVKATIGYDVVNGRSYFGINYYPANNSVVNYDKMKIIQPAQYSTPDPAKQQKKS